MGRQLRSNFMTYVAPPSGGRPQTHERPAPVGSEGFSRELKRSIAEATASAVARHHAKGRPVYVIDDEGDICELMPDRPPRKLSKAELDALT